MTEATRELFNQVLEEINTSSIEQGTRDQMKGLVFQCMKFNNGSSNEVTDIKDTLTMLTVFLIRHNLRSACQPVSVEDSVVAQSKLGQFIILIRPIAWPLAFVTCVALFSPHLVEVLNVVKSFIH